METQNVTVSLPADLLREARHLAVDQGLSLSRFLASLIEERIDWSRRYEEARVRQERMMSESGDHGTNGTIAWSRGELHER
jgi:hypothetical protein